jgi:hypothetical protein
MPIEGALVEKPRAFLFDVLEKFVPDGDLFQRRAKYYNDILLSNYMKGAMEYGLWDDR